MGESFDMELTAGFTLDSLMAVSSVSLDEETVRYVEDESEVRVEAVFSSPLLFELITKKKHYLEASRGEEVSFDEAVVETVSSLEDVLGIMLNTEGEDIPDAGLYKQVDQNRWRKVDTDDLYSTYEELLLSVTEGYTEVPSFQEFRKDFLEHISESEDYELPPEVFVDDLLREHLRNVNTDIGVREKKSVVRDTLEDHGVRSEKAGEIVEDLEDYFRSELEMLEGT